MSIFSTLFAPAPAQVAAQQATPIAPATNPTVPSAATVPAQVNSDGSAVVSSPLDQYKGLWENDPNAPKPLADFSFNADPTKLMEAAKSVDFTKVLTPELTAKIQAGGAAGQQAMLEAMNTVAQMTYAQSSLASSKIAEAANKAAEDRFKAMIPELLRSHTVQNNIRTTNPFANDPAMAPLIEGLQTQFQRKYPNATAQDISEHVNVYLNAAADKITGVRPKPVDKAIRPSMDWDAFMAGN